MRHCNQRGVNEKSFSAQSKIFIEVYKNSRDEVHTSETLGAIDQCYGSSIYAESTARMRVRENIFLFRAKKRVSEPIFPRESVANTPDKITGSESFKFLLIFDAEVSQFLSIN